MRDMEMQDLEVLVAISEEEAIYGDLINDLLRQQLERILETLSDREGEIIKMRFGFYDEPKTFQEISAHFGISRERVRQIESQSMKKLRHPSRTQSIWDYLDD